MATEVIIINVIIHSAIVSNVVFLNHQVRETILLFSNNFLIQQNNGTSWNIDSADNSESPRVVGAFDRRLLDHKLIDNVLESCFYIKTPSMKGMSKIIASDKLSLVY